MDNIIPQKLNGFRSKYPKLFRELVTLEIEAGWYGIIDTLATTIEGTGADFRFTCIKEKYAELRINHYYVTKPTDHQDRVISEAFRIACKSAEQTCEKCSSTADVACRSVNSYIQICCIKCYQTEIEKRDIYESTCVKCKTMEGVSRKKGQHSSPYCDLCYDFVIKEALEKKRLYESTCYDCKTQENVSRQNGELPSCHSCHLKSEERKILLKTTCRSCKVRGIPLKADGFSVYCEPCLEARAAKRRIHESTCGDCGIADGTMKRHGIYGLILCEKCYAHEQEKESMRETTCETCKATGLPLIQDGSGWRGDPFYCQPCLEKKKELERIEKITCRKCKTINQPLESGYCDGCRETGLIDEEMEFETRFQEIINRLRS
ncbi:Hypothetical protein POVR1_LOCUS102 [uncultured virus]|nr:Hypothetical protein POVR1_LOCUS102 [uncultured virus]